MSEPENFGRAIELLTAAEALLDALHPEETEMSPAELASLWNATSEQIRVFLNLYR